MNRSLQYAKAVGLSFIDYLGESRLIWTFGKLIVSQNFPQIAKMGYEKRPKFAFLNYPKWYDLPVISQPQQGDIKIELHQAIRAGDHLDVRIKIGNRVHDFAVARRTMLPKKSGEPYKVIHRNNHSLQYFNNNSHIFKEGEYGYGRTDCIYRGKIDILFSNKEKIEFEIFDGDFKGRYCIFTEKSKVIPETIIRMKDNELQFIERRKFTDSPSALRRAKENTNFIAEEKIDGGCYTIIPGHKSNAIISRRLSSNGEIIDRSPNVPQLRYYKFDESLYGKRIHVEVMAHNGTMSETSGMLNSSPYKSRGTQIRTRKNLVVYIWDIEEDLPYGQRREAYQMIAKKSPRIDNRPWGDLRDRFLLRRLFNPKLIRSVCGSDIHNEDPEKYSERLKNNGEEGTVWKSVDDLYNEGEWVKDKKSDFTHVTIVGFKEGSNSNSGKLGSLIVKTDDNKLIYVGSGLSDQQREDIWSDKDSYSNRMAKIEYFEATENSVRAPRLISIDEKF